MAFSTLALVLSVACVAPGGAARADVPRAQQPLAEALPEGRVKLTDPKLVGWARATEGMVTRLERFLLVDAPLSPLRTGRQPREEDRASYQLPTRQ